MRSRPPGRSAPPAVETPGSRAGAGSVARRAAPRPAVAGRHAKIFRRLGVSPGPVGFERAVDGEALHAGARCQLREQVVNSPRVPLAHDGDADGLGAGGDPEPEIAGHRLLEQPQPLAIQRDLERLVAANRRQPESGASAPDSELVLGVERKHVLHDQAASRAERHALAMVGLRQPARRHIRRDARARRRVAHRQPADLGGGRNVGLHERRRHAQHAGHVVEGLARVVAGEQRRGINRQVEQIPYSVRVFRAVEAMQDGRARVGAGGRRAIERVLQLRGDTIQRRAVGPGCAARRHHARPQLPDHLLPRVRVAPDLRRHRAGQAPARRPSSARCDRWRSTDRAARRASAGAAGLRRGDRWPCVSTARTRPRGVWRPRRCGSTVGSHGAAQFLCRGAGRGAGHQLFEQRNRLRLALRAHGREEDAFGPSQRRPSFLVLDVEARAALHQHAR